MAASLRDKTVAVDTEMAGVSRDQVVAGGRALMFTLYRGHHGETDHPYAFIHVLSMWGGVWCLDVPAELDLARQPGVVAVSPDESTLYAVSANGFVAEYQIDDMVNPQRTPAATRVVHVSGGMEERPVAVVTDEHLVIGQGRTVTWYDGRDLTLAGQAAGPSFPDAIAATSDGAIIVAADGTLGLAEPERRSTPSWCSQRARATSCGSRRAERTGPPPPPGRNGADGHLHADTGGQVHVRAVDRRLTRAATRSVTRSARRWTRSRPCSGWPTSAPTASTSTTTTSSRSAARRPSATPSSSAFRAALDETGHERADGHDEPVLAPGVQGRRVHGQRPGTSAASPSARTLDAIDLGGRARRRTCSSCGAGGRAPSPTRPRTCRAALDRYKEAVDVCCASTCASRATRSCSPSSRSRTSRAATCCCRRSATPWPSSTSSSTPSMVGLNPEFAHEKMAGL